MSNEEGDTKEKEKIDYEILREDFTNYALSFKVIKFDCFEVFNIKKEKKSSLTCYIIFKER